MNDIKAILSAPNAPRALLVSLSHDGQVKHQPVARGASVLDIETELMAHLTDYPCSDAFLAQLQQYCGHAWKREGRPAVVVALFSRSPAMCGPS